MVEWYWRRLMQWSRAFKPIGHVLQRVGKLFSHWTISLQPPFFVRLNASFVNDVCDSPTDSLLDQFRSPNRIRFACIGSRARRGLQSCSPAGARDTFSDEQIQQPQETDPLILPPKFIGTILPSLNHGSELGVSGWTIVAFILYVFMSDTETRDKGVDLLTNLCNKIFAGNMRSPFAPCTGHPLPPQSAGNLFPSCGARYRAHRGTRGWSHHGTGVGIPFGCQIGDKSTQCAFDALKAVSTWGNSAFNMKPRQDTFSNVADRTPRLLRYYV